MTKYNSSAETYWVWTEITESIYPDRKAGEPVWEHYRTTCPSSWVAKGYVIDYADIKKESPCKG